MTLSQIGVSGETGDLTPSGCRCIRRRIGRCVRSSAPRISDLLDEPLLAVLATLRRDGSVALARLA